MKRFFNTLGILSGFLALMVSCKHEQVDYMNEPPEAKEIRMDWWRKARFGMFIHWGLYSVPAGEWEGETNHAEWIRTTAQIPVEEYDKFREQFNPVNFDASKWVKMANDAGMKYMVITSKHHDGFCLFNSKETDFDMMSTPFARDVLKELSDACNAEGIKLCWYHSIMDWHHPDYIPRRSWETDRPSETADFNRYIAYMKAQLKELTTGYGKIGVLWFDGEWEDTWKHENGTDLYNYVRNLQPDIIINNRVDNGRSGMAGMTKEGEYAGDFGTPEQEIPATGIPGKDWETCMTMNDNWGYNKYDDNWKSTSDLIRKLVDITSKGGNFLLNIGPKADGSFPEESIIRLKEIGDWMKVNGEAIYETNASPFRKLDWGRCTQKQMGSDTRLYLHVFDWPEDGILKVPGIFNEPVSATLLADRKKNLLDVSRHEDALWIALPNEVIDSVNSVIVLDITGHPDISYPPVIQSDFRIFIDQIEPVLVSASDNFEIRYTTDGSMPSIESPKYRGSLILNESTTLTVRSFRDNKPASDSVCARFEKVMPQPSEQTIDLKPGLRFSYFEGDWDFLPDFSRLTPDKKGVTSNFNLNEKTRGDYYGFVFEGYIQITRDGIYEFMTDSDDGSQLFVRGKLVVDNDGLHGMVLQSGALALAKGFHPIRVTFFEKGGQDDLKVYCKGPGFTDEPVSDKSLFCRK